MLSKAMATIITQPMFVAKIGLQSRPPPSRKGKPFTRIAEVISYILTNEGWRRLYKGLGPQLSRAILFQGNLIVELILPPLLAYELEAKKKCYTNRSKKFGRMERLLTNPSRYEGCEKFRTCRSRCTSPEVEGHEGGGHQRHRHLATSPDS
ncbi:hypothetical protein Vi05172_g4478 [Venturia inaequalis]|nr:hypothetical protein Vi05172_g4478 [Venturia inaequalis]